MNILVVILIVVAIMVLLFSWLMSSRKKKHYTFTAIPEEYKSILATDVLFYQGLDENKKSEFEKRMMHFLATTRITGVKTDVELQDKVYIAASAIIPIFGFPGWEYSNLNEVLLYPDSFNHDFEQTGEDRGILGMVGDGAYNKVMILSRHELKQAFINKSSKSNTAIHEFVHLVDKTDGTVDGVPELFMDRKYVLPWLQLMQKEMKKMLSDQSDINIYGATNEAEFFAVVSEYFFERPELLEEKHPELYGLLTELFKQDPGKRE
jgi:Mlc titration factor MtfA (ptsG expression regulator)